MNTKFLMSSSAIYLWLLAIFLSFFPDEIYQPAGERLSLHDGLFLRVLGSFYFALAIINWMVRRNLIGGIYSRPIAFGNLMHYGITAVALIKVGFKTHENQLVLIGLSVIYSLFAVAYLYVFTHTPKAVKKQIKN